MSLIRPFKYDQINNTIGRFWYNDEYFATKLLAVLWDTFIRLDLYSIPNSGLTFFCSYNFSISEDVSNTLMVLSPSGLINYVRPSTLAIPCSRTGGGFTSVHSYRCILKLGSWTYNEDLIKLIIKEQDTSRIWSLPDLDIGPISTTQYSEEFDCCPQAYSVYQLSLSVTN